MTQPTKTVQRFSSYARLLAEAHRLADTGVPVVIESRCVGDDVTRYRDVKPSMWAVDAVLERMGAISC